MKQTITHRESGFTLLEVIIVVALIAAAYSVVMPNFSLKSGTEVASRLGRLSADIKAAYDMAVLSGQSYRMVFHLISGEYWLETAGTAEVLISSNLVDRDPTEVEEKDRLAQLDNEFEEYTSLAGQSYVDTKTDKPIPPVSPVLSAKERLRGPVWERVENTEWGKRSLGEALIIKDMQAEHHARKVEVEAEGERAYGMIYFFPSGYVERAFLHIFYRKNETSFDEEQEPYTVTTDPYEGVAIVETGYGEVNVKTEER